MTEILRIAILVFYAVLIVQLFFSEEVREKTFELINLVLKKLWSIF